MFSTVEPDENVAVKPKTFNTFLFSKFFSLMNLLAQPNFDIALNNSVLANPAFGFLVSIRSRHMERARANVMASMSQAGFVLLLFGKKRLQHSFMLDTFVFHTGSAHN